MTYNTVKKIKFKILWSQIEPMQILDRIKDVRQIGNVF
jgi:hypothetical protein